MIDLPYSLVIEATEELDYFGFYSPDLEGFTGIGPFRGGLPVPGEMGHERTCVAPARSRAARAAAEFESKHYDTE